MARFNAAFMSGSVDEKFQNRYNYLLDLLDTGYIVEKMIGNSMSRVEVSPSVGIKISYGTTDMLSIDPTTGDLRVSGDIYVERLRASGSDDYMGFVKYGWGDTAVNFVTGDNDLPIQNMTEYLSITGDADTFTSSMLTILDATPRLATTEVKRNFATTLRIGVNQILSAMDEENTAYLTASGNAANPYISLTAVGATFATRSELKVEANNITFNGNKVWHSNNTATIIINRQLLNVDRTAVAGGGILVFDTTNMIQDDDISVSGGTFTFKKGMIARIKISLVYVDGLQAQIKRNNVWLADIISEGNGTYAGEYIISFSATNSFIITIFPRGGMASMIKKGMNTFVEITKLSYL